MERGPVHLRAMLIVFVKSGDSLGQNPGDSLKTYSYEWELREQIRTKKCEPSEDDQGGTETGF